MMTQEFKSRLFRSVLSSVALATFVLLPTSAFGLLISGPGDSALIGALIQDFDTEASDTYFTDQTFLIGSDGFTVTPLAQELHIDIQWCDDFGTTGKLSRYDEQRRSGQR